MEALTALRQAIISDRPVALQQPAGPSQTPSTATTAGNVALLVIDGIGWPASLQTPFKGGGGRHYTLGGLWTQYALRDKPVSEYIAHCREAKIDFVLVTDKPAVIAYLTGQSEAVDRIDHAFAAGTAVRGVPVSAAGAAGVPGAALAVTAAAAAQVTPAVAAAALSLALAEDERGLEAVLKREMPFRTRSSVLESHTLTQGRVLRDEVFKHFFDRTAPGAVPAAAGGTGTASGRGSSSGAAAVGSKRPRAEGVPVPMPAAAASGPRADPLAGFRGTPIIVVPAAVTATLNMYNAVDFLQHGRYVTPADARAAAGTAPKPAKLTIHRRDARGNNCQYYVVDNVAQLQRHDWCVTVSDVSRSFGPASSFQVVGASASLTVVFVHLTREPARVPQAKNCGSVCARPRVAVQGVAMGTRRWATGFDAD